MLQEDDLGRHDSVVRGREHLVERVEHEMDVHTKAILVLTISRASEKLSTLNDEFGYEFEGSKAFLDRLLSFRRKYEVGTMPDTAQEAPEIKAII